MAPACHPGAAGTLVSPRGAAAPGVSILTPCTQHGPYSSPARLRRRGGGRALHARRRLDAPEARANRLRHSWRPARDVRGPVPGSSACARRCTTRRRSPPLARVRGPRHPACPPRGPARAGQHGRPDRRGGRRHERADVLLVSLGLIDLGLRSTPQTAERPAFVAEARGGEPAHPPGPPPGDTERPRGVRRALRRRGRRLQRTPGEAVADLDEPRSPSSSPPRPPATTSATTRTTARFQRDRRAHREAFAEAMYQAWDLGEPIGLTADAGRRPSLRPDHLDSRVTDAPAVGRAPSSAWSDRPR